MAPFTTLGDPYGTKESIGKYVVHPCFWEFHVIKYKLLSNWNNKCKYNKLLKAIFLCKKILEHMYENGILLPKLFWPAVRKKNSSDREKTLEIQDPYALSM